MMTQSSNDASQVMEHVPDVFFLATDNVNRAQEQRFKKSAQKLGHLISLHRLELLGELELWKKHGRDHNETFTGHLVNKLVPVHTDIDYYAEIVGIHLAASEGENFTPQQKELAARLGFTEAMLNRVPEFSAESLAYSSLAKLVRGVFVRHTEADIEYHRIVRLYENKVYKDRAKNKHELRREIAKRSGKDFDEVASLEIKHFVRGLRDEANTLDATDILREEAEEYGFNIEEHGPPA